MKKLGIGLLTIVFALSFGSCSTNETDIDIPQESLLKSYKLKRDASGAYSIDYNVADNTVSDTRKSLNALTNEIHLSKSTLDSKNSYREEFSLENDKLQIGFFDAETGKKSKLIIEDENITFAKGGSTTFLKTYGISRNSDGGVQLDFEVNNNVSTDFVYNEVLNIYEIHLRKGTNTTNKVFSRTIEMPDSGVLKIDFVNHKNLLSKGESSESVSTIPRVIVIGNMSDEEIN